MLGVSEKSGARHLDAARRLFSLLGESLDFDVAVRLWDGSRVPLGSDVTSPYEIVISGPGVLSSMLRRPTQENLLLHYARGDLAIEGGNLMGFAAAVGWGRDLKKIRQVPKLAALGAALRIASASPGYANAASAFKGAGDDAGFIRFHYDLSNDFYALFLDEQMQYSCAYFSDWKDDLDQAQHDKLEAICQNLRLQPDDRFLDVGCGWGGLLCHAAQMHGVRAHGVTLSQQQFQYTQGKIRKMGLEGRVTVQLGEYSDVEGAYDKIASIEMIEHVGLDNFPRYFRKLRSLLRDRGLLLNQSTNRRAKPTTRRSRQLRGGFRIIGRYIFPGGQVVNLGETVAAMEAARFEVHQVLGWRDHYARTMGLWCDRLWERRKEAEALVGAEKTRLWLAYLAGVTVAYQNGSLRVYQIVASKHASKGLSNIPAISGSVAP